MAGQAAQPLPPPQSMSVSVPSWLPLGQVAWQRPPAHSVPAWQSLLPRQGDPLGQRGQVPPPQSTPVSAPLLTPSLQLGARQVLRVSVQEVPLAHGQAAVPPAPRQQTPPWQSALEPHRVPALQS